MDTEPSNVSADSVRAALRRMLVSQTFARSHQLRRFLEVTVARTLEGRQEELKEYSIAVEACGRKPSYDPRVDAIVRTEAQRLRRKLVKYYEEEGGDDPVRISYPKGGYVPTFARHGDGTERGDSGLRPAPWKLVAATLVLLTGAFAFVVGGQVQVRKEAGASTSVAVLTFDDLSLAPNEEPNALAQATTEALIVRLTRVPGLDVIAPGRFTMLASEDLAHNPATLLEADYLLQGSVQRSGERCRVTAQLIRVEDERNLWAENYTFDRTHSFEVQDRVAEEVAKQLSARVASTSASTGDSGRGQLVARER